MDGIVDAICEMVGEIEDELPGGVAAVGVGCAGLVGRSGSVATSPNIPEIRDFPLRAMLAGRLDRPVAVDNDATAALRAEMACGAASGAGNVLLATFGTGIGAALALDGEIRRGAGGLAGEAGHMIVAPGGPECPAGAGAAGNSWPPARRSGGRPGMPPAPGGTAACRARRRPCGGNPRRARRRAGDGG